MSLTSTFKPLNYCLEYDQKDHFKKLKQVKNISKGEILCWEYIPKPIMKTL